MSSCNWHKWYYYFCIPIIISTRLSSHFFFLFNPFLSTSYYRWRFSPHLHSTTFSLLSSPLLSLPPLLSLSPHLSPTILSLLQLNPHTVPEMLRLSLEELILQILALDLGDPYDFLEAAISPPESLSIRNALKFLGKQWMLILYFLRFWVVIKKPYAGIIL